MPASRLQQTLDNINVVAEVVRSSGGQISLPGLAVQGPPVPVPVPVGALHILHVPTPVQNQTPTKYMSIRMGPVGGKVDTKKKLEKLSGSGGICGEKECETFRVEALHQTRQVTFRVEARLSRSKGSVGHGKGSQYSTLGFQDRAGCSRDLCPASHPEANKFNTTHKTNRGMTLVDGSAEAISRPSQRYSCLGNRNSSLQNSYITILKLKYPK